MTYPVPTMPADPAGTVPQLPQQTILPTSQWLTKNPQLPVSPAAAALGGYTDSTYEAGVANLQNQIAKQYADILQKLGYQDDQGRFIMGSVEDESNRQQALAQRQIGLADEDVTKQAQQDQTLFSGLRGINQARAEFPFVQTIADLQRTTPITLQGLYENAAGLMRDYSVGLQGLLADAATRKAAALQHIPPDAGGGGGGDNTPTDGGGGLPALPTNIPGTGTEGLPVAPSQGANTVTIGGVPYVTGPSFTPTPYRAPAPAPAPKPPVYSPTSSYGIARPVAPVRPIYSPTSSYGIARR